ncbi:DUF4245 domain-containing protein [Kineococcus sp. G2]|uniref:DUF4245 domain-containing protein n=1 Tax=Kineococcus sp. G2 TaxID=3127484 RepID=UPI00301D05E2
MSTTGPGPTPQVSAPGGEDPRGVPRTRRGGSVSSMVISMALILAVVALVVWVVPRPSSVQQPPADVADAAAGASELPFVPPVPEVPQGWTATSAEVNRSTDSVLTWHVGYRTDEGEYLAVEVAAAGTAGWVRAQTAGGAEDGTVQVDGREWQRYLQPDRGRRSLVRTDDGVTVVVTGEADYPVLAELVRATEAGWESAGVDRDAPAA